MLKSAKANGGVRLLVAANPWADLLLRQSLSSEGAYLVQTQHEPTYAGAAVFERSPRTKVASLRTKYFGHQHRDFRDAIVGAATSGDYREASRTDVASCYPSLTPHAVASCLSDQFFPEELVDSIRSVLVRFDSEVTQGLPIGPEMSAVLANIVFRDSDTFLSSYPENVKCVRWSDDHFLFGASYFDSCDALEHLRDILVERGLSLSAHKTETYIDDLDRLLDPSIDISLQVAVRWWTADALREKADGLFQEEFEKNEPNPTRLRYLIKSLIRRRIQSGRIVELLLSRPEKWALAVPQCAAYLRDCMSRDDAHSAVYIARDLFDDGLEEQALHLIGASRRWGFGRIEADYLLGTARNAHDCPLVAGTARAFAMQFDDRASQEMVDDGEFSLVGPFEQRWIIGAVKVNASRRNWLADCSDTSLWPVTAEWRLKTAA